MMKNVIFLNLFLLCCFHANSQNYLQMANECFEKGDYECAKRNYTLFQTFDGKDMSAQIQKADECFRAIIIADNYFSEKKWTEARDRYKTVLDKNPNDPNAKRQYDLCMTELNRSEKVSDIDANASSLERASTTTPQNQTSSSSFTDFIETTNNLNIEMIAVQGGTFTMGCNSEQGSDCSKNETPAHQVTVSNFYIGKYEVTQAQWRTIMGENPSKFKGDNLPVENVSWNKVQEFIRQLTLNS